MARHTYSPKLKAHVVLEVLTGEKTPAQVAKAYGVHPNSVQLWKRRFLERAPEIFSEAATVQECERRIRSSSSWWARRRWRSRSKKLLGPERLTTQEKVALVRTVADRHGLQPALEVLGLPRSTWYYHTRRTATAGRRPSCERRTGIG